MARSRSYTPPFHAWDAAGKFKCTLGMHWRPLGAVVLDEQERLRFPPAPKAPAVYRIRVRQGKRSSIYVGEAVNLRRRFGNYRRPGPTQETSKRINSRLIQYLRAGAEISVSAVISAGWMSAGKGRSEADFSSRAVRRLFENATIAHSGGEDIEVLNC